MYRYQDKISCSSGEFEAAERLRLHNDTAASNHQDGETKAHMQGDWGRWEQREQDTYYNNDLEF